MAVEHYDVHSIIKDISEAVGAAINTVIPSSEFTTASVPIKPDFEAETDETKNFDEGVVESEGEQNENVETEHANEKNGRLKANKALFIDILKDLDSGSGVPYDELIEYMSSKGLSEDEVEEVARDLMDDGKCYEPKIGILKLV
jgi:DNA replicative helicase MCM subunit Mcm2 (Cdc46/Mcm family)